MHKPEGQRRVASFFYQGARVYLAPQTQQGPRLKIILTFDRSKAKHFSHNDYVVETLKLVQKFDTNCYVFI